MASSSKKRCKFTDILRTKYRSFVEGRSDEEVKCTICDSYISIAHKGGADIEKHLNTDKHKKQSRLCASTSKLDSFIKQPDHKKCSTAAEATLAFHVVKHHQSYKSMDCTSSLLRQLFSDSEVARNLACARTKTEAIINNVIAPYTIEILLEKLKDVVYLGLSTDASNHNADKIFPVIIQFFDWKFGTDCKLLELAALPNENSQTISKYLLETLAKYSLKEKCVSFTGDNTNLNFGGVNRVEGNNILTLLNNSLDQPIMGVGCPAHILHNAIRHATDLLEIDIESLVMKIFNHFSVYTVRTEKLNKFCDYIEINYEKLLYHSKTRWLSLFPAIERILKLYEALKEYFLTTDKIPVMIKKFFENDLNEIYLWYLHSLMAIFQSKIALLEREKNSVAEVLCILNKTKESLAQRKEYNFIPMKVRELFEKYEINEENKDKTNNEINNMYKECIDYIDKWIKPLDCFTCFDWLIFVENQEFNFDDIIPSIVFLKDKGVIIDDVKLFEEFCLLKNFLSTRTTDYFQELAERQWSIFFNYIKDTTLFSELLKICQYFFSILPHNANVERVFSLMSSQWTKERNRLSVESIRALLISQYNLRNINCEDFYKNILLKKDFLSAVSSGKKYNKH